MINVFKKVLCCCSLFIAVGCGSRVVDFPLDNDNADAGTAGSGNVSDAGECDDSQCPVGSVCVDNECKPVNPCDDMVCPENEVCADGCCVWQDPCDVISCPQDTTCVDGQCKPNAPQCCVGQVLHNNTCIDIDPCENVQCCEGTVCHEGRCEKVDPCDGVKCSFGKTCKLGECVCSGYDPDEREHCQSGKSLICHYSHGNKHNICVDNNAVPAHLKHGDKIIH